MDMWFLQQGCRITTPRDMLHSSQKSMTRSCGPGVPPTMGSHLFFSGDGADHLGYTKPPPVEEGRCSLPVPDCSWVEVVTIASLKAMPRYCQHRRESVHASFSGSIPLSYNGAASGVPDKDAAGLG